MNEPDLFLLISFLQNTCRSCLGHVTDRCVTYGLTFLSDSDNYQTLPEGSHAETTDTAPTYSRPEASNLPGKGLLTKFKVQIWLIDPDTASIFSSNSDCCPLIVDPAGRRDSIRRSLILEVAQYEYIMSVNSKLSTVIWEIPSSCLQIQITGEM